MKHPLLNAKSSHYDKNGEPAIKGLEKEQTVIEQIGWCKGNIYKYKYRQDHKGQKESDLEKIEDYTRYKNFLCELRIHNQYIEVMTVSDAYRHLGIEMEYEV